jgi:hypothetical protein
LHALSKSISDGFPIYKSYFFIRSIKFYFDFILFDAILGYFNPKKIILFEEGIFKHMGGYDINADLHKNKKNDFMLSNRVFINVCAPFETIYERLKERKDWTEMYDRDEDFRKSIYYQIKKSDSVVSQLKKLNAHVLDIDSTNKIDDNIKLILYFINKINSAMQIKNE